MTTNHDASWPVEQIMASGLKRISSLVEQHGITSPEVFSACERWGSILDDVNHPDSTCRWCGTPVTWLATQNVYVHRDDTNPVMLAEGRLNVSALYCKTHAGKNADPELVTS